MVAAVIQLTRGHEAIVDDEDLEFLSGYRWRCGRPKNCHHAYAFSDIKQPDGRWKTTGMHRLLMGDPKGMEVDHINGNGLDNRKSNLRVVTRQQNLQNQKSRGGTSQYCGVHLADGKWTASITHNYRQIRLGTFPTEIAAAEAYDAKASELFGAFARLNFPCANEQAA